MSGSAGRGAARRGLRRGRPRAVRGLRRDVAAGRAPRARGSVPRRAAGAGRGAAKAVRERGRTAGHGRRGFDEDRRQDGQPRGQAGRSARARRGGRARVPRRPSRRTLWGIGRATATKLHARGIGTVGRPRRSASSSSSRCSGAAMAAAFMRWSATATDAGGAGGPPRSFGSTRSLGRDDDPPRALEAAAERVAKRLQSSGRAGRTITLHLRFDDHTLAARSRTLPAATADATTIHYTAVGAAGHAAPADAHRRQRGQPRGGG